MNTPKKISSYFPVYNLRLKTKDIYYTTDLANNARLGITS